MIWLGIAIGFVVGVISALLCMPILIRWKLKNAMGGMFK